MQIEKMSYSGRMPSSKLAFVELYKWCKISRVKNIIAKVS